MISGKFFAMRQSGYYEMGEKRAQRVSDLFSSIATRYDLINDMQSGFMHRYWKSRVIWALKPSKGEPALDICCGTGDISELLWNRGAQVTGLDFNPEMLTIAQIRAADLAGSGVGPGGRQPDYILGDALSLPFPDTSFDLISMSSLIPQGRILSGVTLKKPRDVADVGPLDRRLRGDNHLHLLVRVHHPDRHGPDQGLPRWIPGSRELGVQRPAWDVSRLH